MSVSISALQRNASAVIKQVVASGHSEEVTDRGHVVAILSPPPVATGLQRLREQGHCRPADSGPWDDLFGEIDEGARIADLMAALDEQRDTDR